MVWVVVSINLLLSLGLLWLTWQTWQFKKVLASAVVSIHRWTAACQNGLSVSPSAILIAQKGTDNLRVQYQSLMLRLQRLTTIFAILGQLQAVSKAIRVRLTPNWQKPSHDSRRSDRNGKRRR